MSRIKISYPQASGEYSAQLVDDEGYNSIQSLRNGSEDVVLLLQYFKKFPNEGVELEEIDMRNLPRGGGSRKITLGRIVGMHNELVASRELVTAMTVGRSKSL